MNKISIATFQGDSRACEVYGLWQYDYGQVLRIQDLGLPPAVEIHFSLSEKGGSSITRVGTTKDGGTDVVIPDSLLENGDTAQDYWIYAYIYLTDADSGSTEYKIALKVKSRPRPEAIERPEDQELFREAISAVNDAADRAETAEKNAKNSEEESGKNAQRAKESAEAAEKTKKDALKEITQEKEDAVTAIDQKERDSVTNITQHTNSEIQRIDDHISESESGLEQTIKDAVEKKSALDDSIAESATAKTNLDSSVEIGKTQDATLNQTIETSSTSKAALDSSILAADSKNTDLSNTVESATTVDTSLKDQIKTGTQLKVDLMASGKQAVKDIQETTNKCLESIPEDYTELTSKVSANENNIRTKAPAIVRSVTSEFGAPVQITGSANAPLQGMKLYGRSEQKSTSGKNLFDAELLNAESNFNAALSPQGFWRIIIPVENKDITISIKTTAKNAGYLMVNVDGSIGGKWMAHGSVINLNRTATLTPTSGVLYLNFSNNLETIKKTYEAVGYIQVEYGTEATDYEPYTGGLPSPSPEYPQEIESVGGDGEIGVSVTGKNLWIHGDCSSDRYVEKEVNLQPGAYTISFDAESEGETEDLIFGALTKDYGWVTSYYIQRGKGVTLTFVVESGFKIGYLRVYSENTSAGSIGKKITIKNVMLNHGSELETYEIGKRVASIISTPNGLPGIPVPSNTAGITYTDAAGQAWIADEIDLERGKYVQRIQKYVLDGSSDEIWNEYATYELNGWYYNTQDSWQHSYAKGYCSQYDVSTNAQELGKNNKKIRIGASNNVIYFVMNDFYDKSLEDHGLANWKAHLAANPLTVMTYLDTPIETDLTEAQLQAYKALTTFKPMSIISNDAGAQMDVDYALDTETYINGLNETCNSNLDKLNETISENKKSDELTQRRLDALWKLNQGIVYEFQSDDTDGYKKDIPTGGRYVGLKRVGGESLVWGRLIGDDGWGATYGTIKKLEDEHAYEYTYVTLGSGNINRMDYVYTKFIKGHVYFLKFGFYSTKEQPCGYSAWDGATRSSWDALEGKTVPNKWVTLSSIYVNSVSEYGNSCSLRPYITGSKYVEVGDTVKYRIPMIFDLTAMFGAGNEPSTVAEFESLFPADYYPYSEPEVVHAGVETVESLGRNLFHITKESDCNRTFNNQTKRIILPGEYVIGLSSNNFVTSLEDSKVDEAGISFTFKKNKSGYGIGFGVACERGKTYIHSRQSVLSNASVLFYEADGTFITYTYNNPFTIPENAKYTVFIVNNSSACTDGNTISAWNIQIEEAGTQTAYSPYSKTTRTIPQSIQDLDGYGWSAGSVYNYVDFENKNFIQSVGCVELGSLDWKKITNSDRHAFYATLPEKTVYGKNVMDSMGSDLIGTINILWAKSTYLATEYEGMFTCTYNTDNDIVYIFEKYNDMSEAVFRQNMSGVILYYELAEPIITDISDCIDEIFKEPFEVEAGGTLTFKNSLGDSYRIPVPNSEEYVIKLSEVASDE